MITLSLLIDNRVESKIWQTKNKKFISFITDKNFYPLYNCDVRVEILYATECTTRIVCSWRKKPSSIKPLITNNLSYDLALIGHHDL